MSPTDEPPQSFVRKAASADFSKPRVIVCSNVLPVNIFKNQHDEWEATWDLDNVFEEVSMYAQLNAMEEYDVLHVGVPNTFVPYDERDAVEAILRPLRCYPVYVSSERAHNHFQGYCQGVLYPVFHNVFDMNTQTYAGVRDTAAHERRVQHPMHGGDQSNRNDDSWKEPKQWNVVDAEEAAWPDHCATNRQFTAKVLECYTEGDVIWVHDYPLLLLPSFLRRKLPLANIGLFTHVPFPSSEIFRTLAAREDLLRAMLCADHIGFHLFEYARHFLTCCSRMLGTSYEAVKGGILRMKYMGRSIVVTCSYAVPDVHYIRKIVDASPIWGGAYAQNRKLLLGIDHVDGLRGIALKLVAFEKFLRMYPHRRHDVVLKQVGLTQNVRPDDYSKCHRDILSLVEKINLQWGDRVVEYEEMPVMLLSSRLKLMQQADVFIVTAVRQGVNSFPFEYLLARGTNPGVMLLSEFTASTRVLNGAIRFNPKRTEDVAVAIEQALEMSLPERTARRSRDLPFLEQNTVVEWGKRVIKDIINAKTEDSAAVMKFGFGFDYRYRSDHNKAELLEFGTVLNAFKRARNRLLVFDYSGTLVETSSMEMYVKSGGKARTWHYLDGSSQQKQRSGGNLETRDPINDTVRSYLVELCRDSSTTVVVISSDLREELAHACFGIKNLVLVAENGFVFNDKGSTKWLSILDHSTGGDWYGGHVEAELDMSWQVKVEAVMKTYSDRTNGSFIWTAPSAVSFNYILSDPEFGSLQSQNMILELELVLAGLPLIIEKGKGFVTVRLRGVNRGAALKHIINAVNKRSPHNPIDLVICCGDDEEDDLSFQSVANYAKERPPSDVRYFNTRIGKVAQKADYYLEETADLHDLLGELSDSLQMHGAMMRKTMSTGTLNFVTKDMLRNSHLNIAGSFGKLQPDPPSVRGRDNKRHSDVSNLPPPTGTSSMLSSSGSMPSRTGSHSRSILSLVGMDERPEPLVVNERGTISPPRVRSHTPPSVEKVDELNPHVGGPRDPPPSRKQKTEETQPSRPSSTPLTPGTDWADVAKNAFSVFAIGTALYMMVNGRRHQRSKS